MKSIKNNLKILENVELKKYSTFYVGGICKYFIEINNKEEILEVFKFISIKKKEGVIDNFYILGGGSNTIFSNDLLKTCIIKINIKKQGKEEVNIVNDNVFIKASAGDDWDDLVLFACNNNYYGLENLSYIPGSVGASPVQNIGAYGVEVKNIISSIHVYNIEKNISEVLENSLLSGSGGEAATKKENNLEFEYRDSIFKKNKNKYIIISVTFKLSKIRDKSINYVGLNIQDGDTAQEIREKIIIIRKSKLPDWKVTPNCGSFFKNPIMSKKDLDCVLLKNKDLKYFEFLDLKNNLELKYKLSAAQIIESLNLKGLEIGGAKVSEGHALIIINENKKASFEDVFTLSDEIIKKVYSIYNVILEREVNML